MGIEGGDFIIDPNRLESDDGELDLDEHPEVVLAEDYFAVDGVDDDDDYVSEDDALNDRPLEASLQSDASSDFFMPEDSDNFLTDDDYDEEDDDALCGVMVDGTFVQTGAMRHHGYNTRLAAAANVNSVGEDESATPSVSVATGSHVIANNCESNASKNGNAGNGSVESGESDALSGQVQSLTDLERS